VLPDRRAQREDPCGERGRIKRVIIPKRNSKDLDDIPKIVRKSLDFVLADHMDDVLDAALIKK
jgi:ATP-dependent Lon protease